MTESRFSDAGGCGCVAADTTVAAQCCCVVRDLTRVIGRKHAMAIVNRLATPATRFSDLERELGIGPSVLAETLWDLEAVGLVRRTVLDDTPPRTEYHLTPAGETLRRRLRPLLETVRRTR